MMTKEVFPILKKLFPTVSFDGCSQVDLYINQIAKATQKFIGIEASLEVSYSTSELIGRVRNGLTTYTSSWVFNQSISPQILNILHSFGVSGNGVTSFHLHIKEGMAGITITKFLEKCSPDNIQESEMRDWFEVTKG